MSVEKKKGKTDNNSNAWKIDFLTLLGWPGPPRDCGGAHGTSDYATSAGTRGAAGGAAGGAGGTVPVVGSGAAARASGGAGGKGVGGGV